jgi:hypothetical protein
MSDEFDLLLDGTVVSTGRGGKRAGAGRKPGYSPKQRDKIETPDDAPAADQDVSVATKLAYRKAVALTEKEEALARQNWLKYEVDSKNYLPRSAYREASATLLAEVSQALRSIPDLLERKVALSPDALDMVQKVIDDQLNTLADGLEMFAGSDE